MGFWEDRTGLRGKTAAVVGGGSGIGAAITLALAEAGVDVAILDIAAPDLAATAAKAEAFGQRTLALEGDAVSRDVLGRFYGEVERAFGGLDILVNVVGGTLNGRFTELPLEATDHDIRRNYGYVVDSVRLAVPLIRKRGRGGAIVNFTTIEAHRGAAGFAVYAGAKAAVANFTRSLAVELGAEGIRLNCLAPDTTPSKGNIDAMRSKDTSGMAALPPEVAGMGLQMYIPMKRQPSVDDLANGVLFLVSDLAASVTGTTLHVDGGTMAAAGFLDWPFGDGFLPVPLDGTLSRLA
jgi:NAD(P)-dependent dehydrogenase (short-subunit alcohol dehydrogenase family)